MLDTAKKAHKIRNLLQTMRRDDLITTGPKRQRSGAWVRVSRAIKLGRSRP
jgi:hypothetical protein